MDTKKERKYLIVLGLISIVTTGLMTNFKFTNIEVQMNDIYFVVTPIKAIIYLTLVLWTTKNLYLLIDLMTDRYNIIAVLVAIINPLVALFIIMLIYFNIQAANSFKQLYPNNNLTAQIIPICILVALVSVQAITEIQVLKKLRGFIR